MASIASGRVAGAVPVGGVLAVVEQVLDQARGHLALGIGPCRAASSSRRWLRSRCRTSTTRFLGQFEIGGLIFVVLDDELPMFSSIMSSFSFCRRALSRPGRTWPWQ